METKQQPRISANRPVKHLSPGVLYLIWCIVFNFGRNSYVIKRHKTSLIRNISTTKANLVPRLISTLHPVCRQDRRERRKEPGYEVGQKLHWYIAPQRSEHKTQISVLPLAAITFFHVTSHSLHFSVWSQMTSQRVKNKKVRQDTKSSNFNTGILFRVKYQERESVLFLRYQTQYLYN